MKYIPFSFRQEIIFRLEGVKRGGTTDKLVCILQQLWRRSLRPLTFFF